MVLHVNAKILISTSHCQIYSLEYETVRGVGQTVEGKRGSNASFVITSLCLFAKFDCLLSLTIHF